MNLDFYESCAFVKTRTRSPIEARFLGAWMKYLIENSLMDGVTLEAAKRLTVEEFLAIPQVQPFHYLNVQCFNAIWTQQKIEDYRVDFVLGRIQYSVQVSEDGAPGKEVLIRLPLLVVECDGHNFHERTKEQAQNDKSRDRRLNALGYRVLRFTGSEIHNRPKECALEIDNLFDCLASPRSGSVLE